MTFRQALELGAHVRKGESGTLVVYANSFKVADNNKADDDREETEHEVHYLKGYTVFNVEQIDGLPTQYTTQATPSQPNAEARIARAEHLAASSQATIRHGGGRAFYAPQSDLVQLPPFEAFRDAEAYYATLLHELTHWTAHRSRLARELGKRFGDAAYAAEELIAELGAAFLCAELGVTLEPRDDHASYLAIWLKVLRSDQRAIFTAASHAQKAAQFLLGLASERGA
jgi:antirestriction protein ArdC